MFEPSPTTDTFEPSPTTDTLEPSEPTLLTLEPSEPTLLTLEPSEPTLIQNVVVCALAFVHAKTEIVKIRVSLIKFFFS